MSAKRKANAGPKKFVNREVAAVFKGYPGEVGKKLAALRELIFDAALTTKGVGKLQETLKWGQPSYVTSESGSGSTVRIDQVKEAEGQYAIYFHCQTNLVERFRELYPNEFEFSGNRALLLDVKNEIPEEAVRHCVSLAFTYHLRKKKKF